MSRVSQYSPSSSICHAAQYIRMSTDYQKYSPENQKLAISEFAARQNIVVVATYEDAGKSGVTLHGRTSMVAPLPNSTRGGSEIRRPNGFARQMHSKRSLTHRCLKPLGTYAVGARGSKATKNYWQALRVLCNRPARLPKG
ncbi:hypothetical protein GCT13_02250 [Paraburkholderia sp. CNPSo 3157]|uniref:Resolvase/invertase-type recombinase catalytic domain-containing protein n=1 Tax=Paraburkholderia franconis TaxID=2654983 RepID=A0A7X1TDY2_9BURK|nr:recombinase family protein [Paraburkholderia franconis]MPW15765.1 hypothetical protein [Paraburkholderia franconis]